MNNFWVSILSFHCMSHGDRTWVGRLGGESLCPLSHLAGPGAIYTDLLAFRV